VFDVVNAITIQGLETRPTDSFALLVLSILALVIFIRLSCVVSCAVLRLSCGFLCCPAVFRPTGNGCTVSLFRYAGHCKRYRATGPHRAGVDVDVTPPTGGPVGHPPNPATLCDVTAVCREVNRDSQGHLQNTQT